MGFAEIKRVKNAFYFLSTHPTIPPFFWSYPHVHVIGPDFQAMVRIADAAVFAGTIPSRYRREALDWIAANHDRLVAKWDEIK